MALPGTRTRAEHVISSKKPASQEGTAPVRPPSATVRGQNGRGVGSEMPTEAQSSRWLGRLVRRHPLSLRERTLAAH